MKKIIQYLNLTAIIFLSACSSYVNETVTYQINEPILMSTDEFRSSVKISTTPQVIETKGKICYYNGYLYISEPGKGIHIINDTDPRNPVNVGFIELLGNGDLAIRNNILYADSYIDLVWFDINNPAQPTLQGRLENVFPEALPLFDNDYNYDYEMCYKATQSHENVIVGWTVEERTEEIENYTGGWDWHWGYYDDDVALTENSSGTSSNGTNGSMSRFAQKDSLLYTVLNNQMSVFDLSNDKAEKVAEDIYIGWNVETIFSYKDNLFMGTPTGMVIYSAANPLQPVYLSSISHVYGCDPVVVSDDKAYVTVYSGNNCEQDTNKLMIIDVSDAANPKQLVSYNMTKPMGLGIDNDRLFLCDDGLKVFTITDSATLASQTEPKQYIKQIKHYSGYEGYDLIPINNIVMLIAEDGIYQYDYSDINDIKYISKISFGN
ncbi:MAG: hypothetical protein PHH37_06055 [Paludibacter sp.]|nr:hypothetical protein [Paludibacter sp.]